MKYDEILYSLRDGVATITLNRPERLNALTPRMREEILDALDRAIADNAVRAIVFTGSGRAFCAGPDMGGEAGVFGSPKESRGRVTVDASGQIALRIFASTKPVIAAINGHAIGVGIGLTLPMDVRLAADTAKMGFLQARRGVMLEACSSWFLPRVVGLPRALEWVTTGRTLSAAEAVAGGLVREALPAEELLPAALELAREIADNTSSVAVAVSRQLLLRSFTLHGPAEAHLIESRLLAEMGGAPDAREGIASFRDRRAPHFPGRIPNDLPASYPWWENETTS